MSLKPHHLAWLERHPERDAEWLRKALREGFDVHHIDGDHGNNDPCNLVLIETADHFMLHGGSGLKRLVLTADGWGERRPSLRGKDAYELRAGGLTWGEVAQRLYKDSWSSADKRDKGRLGQYALKNARVYALEHGLVWPIAHPGECRCTRCKAA